MPEQVLAAGPIELTLDESTVDVLVTDVDTVVLDFTGGISEDVWLTPDEARQLIARLEQVLDRILAEAAGDEPAADTPPSPVAAAGPALEALDLGTLLLQLEHEQPGAGVLADRADGPILHADYDAARHAVVLT